MVDLRVTSGLSATALRPTQPTEAARAAQRAFFHAALNATAPAAASRPVETRPTAHPPVQAAAQGAPAAETARYLRPGSLLDIKI